MSRYIDPAKWTAPPTQYDRDKLEEQENHEDLESDTHLDDEE